MKLSNTTHPMTIHMLVSLMSSLSPGLSFLEDNAIFCAQEIN
jgi:hypothetical protein